MAEAKLQENPATIRPCTGLGIVYKAYQRPYESGSSSKVLTLFASCYYLDAPWEIFFSAVQDQPGTYQLLEKVPTVTYGTTSFYAASYCSGFGLVELGDTVTLVDASGEHQVPVEAME